MSGGSHDYICFKIEEELNGQMEDIELNDLIKDIAKLAYDLEWYHSGDTCQKNYTESVIRFKQKWFRSNREERLKQYIDDALKKLKDELYRLIGETTQT